jgi:hypothetical protein
LRDIRSHTASAAFGLGGIGGIIGRRNATRNKQASNFAEAAAAIAIPEKPNSPDKIAPDNSTNDQRSIPFRMASLNGFAWRRDS